MKIINNKDHNNTINIEGLIEKDANITLKIIGKNNIVELGDIRRVSKIDIQVIGDNNYIKLGNLRRVGSLRLIVKNQSKVCIGDFSTIEEAYILADFGRSIIINEDCMISFRVDIRTTDGHGIYSLESGDLLNDSGDIVLGNHVWIAQGVIVSKNTVIGNSSVVGARSYLQNVKIPNNSLVVGTPARIVKSNITWDRRITSNLYEDNANLDHLHKRYLN
jgi:acetyltransferase-like isoleucine patch superfamily enzyme